MCRHEKYPLDVGPTTEHVIWILYLFILVYLEVYHISN